MGRASTPLLFLIALGFFFGTYNLVTLVIHHTSDSLKLGDNGSEWFHDAIRSMTEKKNLKYHVALTATDAPYSKWQCRIMYYWYKKVKDLPGSDMGGFTRVLHSGSSDNLMEEIPTFVVDPLPDGLDRVSHLFFFLFLIKQRFIKGLNGRNSNVLLFV